MPANAQNSCLNPQNPCVQYFDITSRRSSWKWADLNSLQIVIDQSAFGSTKKAYYDAVGVRITTADGSDPTSALVMSSADDTAPVNTLILSNVFPSVTRAVNVWNEAPYWQGSGMTVAVVDSGSFKTNGIGSRLIGEVNFNSAEHTANDKYGHGTFVVGLIGDDGSNRAESTPVLRQRRICWDCGSATTMACPPSRTLSRRYSGFMITASTYNIRVVNLSLNSSVYQSYHTSPL